MGIISFSQPFEWMICYELFRMHANNYICNNANKINRVYNKETIYQIAYQIWFVIQIGKPFRKGIQI